MSIVENALRREKMKLTADALPRDQRTVGCFRRLIAALRTAEAEVNDRLSFAQHELNAALLKNLEMVERIRCLEADLLRLRLKDSIEQLPALTVADRTKLL